MKKVLVQVLRYSHCHWHQLAGLVPFSWLILSLFTLTACTPCSELEFLWSRPPRPPHDPRERLRGHRAHRRRDAAFRWQASARAPTAYAA
jgi:hypothetical protein